MLVSFTVENWKSFRRETTFLMDAGEERQHIERVPVSKQNEIKIVPITAIYGGNASGKTNLFEALSFVQDCVVGRSRREDSPIGADPFRLDVQAPQRPSRFSVELLSEDAIYQFSFAVKSGLVTGEMLTRQEKSKDVLLYERKGGKFRFGSALNDKRLLREIAGATRPNELFLGLCCLLSIDSLAKVLDWFRNSLTLVSPHQEFFDAKMYFEDAWVSSMFEWLLPLLDTGISRLEKEEIPLESYPMPDEPKERYRNFPRAGQYRRFLPRDRGLGGGFVAREGGDLVVKGLAALHRGENGKEFKFSLEQESAGTRRLLDFLAAIVLLVKEKSTRVFFIDDVDRSLHTNLTKELIEKFLMSCGADSRSQLIFTTHDVLLMDQALLRREEMWIAERNRAGKSSLTPLSKYGKIPHDKDIRKIYLSGVLGGTPELLTEGLDISGSG